MLITIQSLKERSIAIYREGDEGGEKMGAFSSTAGGFRSPCACLCLFSSFCSSKQFVASFNVFSPDIPHHLHTSVSHGSINGMEVTANQLGLNI